MSRPLKGTVTAIDLVAKERRKQIHPEDDTCQELLHAAVMLVDSIMLLADEGRLPSDCISGIEEQLIKLLAQVKDPDWLDEVKILEAATNIEAEIRGFFLQFEEVPAH